MSAFGTVLKHTLNRLTKRIAMGRSGPFAIVRHVGRKSGTSYETPLIVQPTEGGLVIELTYGANVDWYRNVRAAGRCGIRYHGVEYAITGFEELDAATGIAAFTPGQQRILRLLRRSHFVKFVGAPV
ncbi:MAG: nitroreductase family deazaflavin-dependent oxidoreductase [Rhodoglobus sp.]